MLRSTLRADLVVAMKARQPDAVSALRTAIAALDNAEAVSVTVEPPEATSEHVAGAYVGIGRADVPRRVLSLSEVEAVLREQVDEHSAEADRYDAHGHHETAVRLRRMADTLRTYLSP